MAIPYCGECKHGLTRQSDKFRTCGCALMPSPLTDWEQGMVRMELTDMVRDLSITPVLYDGEDKTPSLGRRFRPDALYILCFKRPKQ
jgi:hypothetical protein